MSYYLVLLLICKFGLSIAYFLVYDLLKVVHVVHFLFLAKTLASLCLISIQKPFSSGKPITRHQWFGIARHSLCQNVVHLLWLFGLSLCGPLRTTLLFEHKAIVVIAGVGALFTGAGGHSKMRGALCFLSGVLSLLFLDHDDEQIVPTEHPEGQYHHGISHIFYFLFNWLGFSDHKAGVLLLVLVLCLQTFFQNSARHLSVDIGGAKRLNALSTLMSSGMLAPWAFILRLTDQPSSIPWGTLFFPILIGAAIFFVLDYYVEATSKDKLDSPYTARMGSLMIFASSLTLTYLWQLNLFNIFTSSNETFVLSMEHKLSGGVVFSWLMFVLATLILSATSKAGTKGNFVGYSASGLPLYSFNIPGSTQSTFQIFKTGLLQIIKENDSKKIFYFLCLNLSFTFVELLYGIWANSLGLISDGFHMLFDCSALVLGLSASLLARKKPSKTFSYGYGRVEVLSGFVNGLFLIVVALMVFSEAVSRIYEPPKIVTEKLMTVSVLGLIVNFIGIIVFRNSHNHSHGGSSHGHSHNANLQGVFLHILADTLGSIGVIVSSFVIDKFGLFVADPICSLFISCLIFVSVLPLLKSSSQILLLRVPKIKEAQIRQALSKVLEIEGVQSYSSPHFWEHSSGNLIGTLHVQIKIDIGEQKVISQVQHIFKELGFSQFTVQIENEKYFQYLTGLGNTKLLNYTPFPNQTLIPKLPSSIKSV